MEAAEETRSEHRRLGRGLNALLGGGPDGGEQTRSDGGGEFQHIDVNAIERNPFQPRADFDDESLGELAESIRQHGILQPLLVRRRESGFQLVAGERRLLAAKKAGWTTVPCHVRDMEDRGVNEAAIEENLKRKDLNVLEKAAAFRTYLDRFGTSIEELAARLSMNRSNVSNMLRLLDLPDAVKQLLLADKITYGHARALLSLEQAADQAALCERIESETLSVRQTEAAVRATLQGEGTIPFQSKEKSAGPVPTNHVLSLQEQLRDLLGAKVEITLKGKESGKIIIHFGSNDDFERILQNLRRAA